MTQKTLDSETEKFLEYTPSREIQFDNGKVVKEYIISRSEMFEFARSIAEKTVEAVRVEEKHTNINTDVYMQTWNDGHNQAITEQSNLASHWLGKE